MLHQVSYQELKSLMLQYPYAANLRYLMLVKSLLDQNKEHERNLILASLSSIDRRKLRQLVMQYDLMSETSDNYEMAGEFLELKDLSTLEEVLVAGSQNQETPPEHAAAIDGSDEGSGIEFLDEIVGDTPSDKAAEKEDLDEQGGSLPALEDLLDEGATDDSLYPTNKPIASPKTDIAESAEANDIEDLEIEDTEDIEIEESLDGLFDVEYHEPNPETELENELIETIIQSDDADGGTAEDKAPPANEAQSDEGGYIEETEITPQSSSDIPLEITNDEPPSENELDPNDEQPSPSPKSAFSSYRQIHHHKTGLLAGGLNIFSKKEKDTPPIHDPIIPKEKPNRSKADIEMDEPEDVAKDMAADSLNEDYSIATETLAGILERQGHFDKAIKMYEKLSLQYPEKSSTFAAKIEKLKKK